MSNSNNASLASQPAPIGPWNQQTPGTHTHTHTDEYLLFASHAWNVEMKHKSRPKEENKAKWMNQGIKSHVLQNISVLGFSLPNLSTNHQNRFLPIRSMHYPTILPLRIPESIRHETIVPLRINRIRAESNWSFFSTSIVVGTRLLQA